MNRATPVYLTAEIREIERMAATLPDSANLMEEAGFAAAQIAAERLLRHDKYQVLILAGPGNNGGDAFVVARYLKQWWFNVTLVFTGDRSKLSNDAKQALDAWLMIDNNVFSEIPANEKWHGIIDGLFGIGLDQQNNRNLEGNYLNLVNAINQMNLPVLSLDVPSGLGSDNGCVYGAVIHATITVTFIGLKPGLLTNFGPEYCGEILVRDLGLDVFAMMTPHIWVINQQAVQKLLPPPRPANSHKGTFGSIGIMGGSTGMIGATLLAGRAALKLGAGRVYLGLIARNSPVVDSTQPELMLRSPHELFKLDNLTCLVIGPGLGMESDGYSWINCALSSELPLVIDADALNHIAIHTHLAEKLQQRHTPAILTPHPAEAARLLNCNTATIQNDRMAAALKLSERFNCHVVLKGAGSICVSPDGDHHINVSGNSGLSSAGTGDVLSGIIGALLTQNLEIRKALLLAVFLHGAAADSLLKQNNGPLGMTASEITDSARLLLNSWIYNSNNSGDKN
ncbi:MAG: NAD(P)H-hydrate dehydratase [Nitrosomonas sp.]|nr:NAD(P)H-hydrate dehydratase [Nitrosomonas sp.]MDP1949488.1 NAD(P)H-hydrate dehydratase [Nitrosomonas sp.]